MQKHYPSLGLRYDHYVAGEDRTSHHPSAHYAAVRNQRIDRPADPRLLALGLVENELGRRVLAPMSPDRPKGTVEVEEGVQTGQILVGAPVGVKVTDIPHGGTNSPGRCVLKLLKPVLLTHNLRFLFVYGKVLWP